MFEVLTGWKGAWNAGDLCTRCIVHAVHKAGDVPELFAAEARERGVR